MMRKSVACMLILCSVAASNAVTASTIGLGDISEQDNPFIFSSVSITNLSASESVFTVNASLPVMGGFSASLMGGSVVARLIDTSGDGHAALSGSPVYTALVDNNPVLQLLQFLGTSSCSGAGCSTTVSDYDGVLAAVLTDDSVPVGTASLPGPGVLNSIDIYLSFILSPGDTVELQSYFELKPVPIPAAIWLLLSGILGLGFLGKPKKSSAENSA